MLYIIRLFMKGERFPRGKLPSEKHSLYLTQSIDFITESNRAIELVQINARSFFLVMSDLYLNKQVSTLLTQLNNDKDIHGLPSYSLTPHFITEKLEDVVSILSNVAHIKFEFSLFILKIAISDTYKYTPQLLSKKLFSSISYLLQQCLSHQKSPQKTLLCQQSLLPFDGYFSGPEDLDLEELEQDIIEVLPFYSMLMGAEEVENVIGWAKELGIDGVRIHIYEEKKEFEQWIDIYLFGRRRKEIFNWLQGLFRKKNLMGEEDIREVKGKILKVIAELVKTDSVRTGEVIDNWLPDSQLQVISKLSSEPELQLRYLQDFLNEREEEIRINLLSTKKEQKNESVTDFKQLLRLHVKLLADKDSKDLKNVVLKDYYPIDCLDEYENDESPIVKEALAYLYKRSGNIDKSLKLFLELIQRLSYDDIKYGLLYENDAEHGNTMTFGHLFREICEILIKYTGRPDFSNDTWSNALKAFFKIKQKHAQSPKRDKDKAVQKLLFNKISEFLRLMSKYVDFNEVLKMLLSSDKTATFKYAHEWLKHLFDSQSDQEFLYRSAKILLANENTNLIDNLVEQHENGLKGNMFQK